MRRHGRQLIRSGGLTSDKTHVIDPVGSGTLGLLMHPALLQYQQFTVGTKNRQQAHQAVRFVAQRGLTAYNRIVLSTASIRVGLVWAI